MNPGRAVAMRAALAAAVGALLGYQAPFRATVPAESPLFATPLASGFYAGEEGRRWTAGRATLQLPDLGAERLRVEVDVDGWRPAAQDAPVFQLASGSLSQGVRLERPRTVALVTRSTGLWTSTLELALESDTFRPQGDPRSLGVRFYRLRLSDEGPWRPRRPPLRPLALSALGAALLLLLIERLELRRTACWAIGACFLGALGLFALERVWASVALWAAVPALGLAWAASARFPSGARRLIRSLGATLGTLGAALRRLVAAEVCAAAAAGLLLLLLAERTVSVLELDLGSGQEAAVATGLGPYDSDGGRAFRSVRRGAAIDLSSLGSGPFGLTLLAAAPAPRPPLQVARVGAAAITAPAGLSEAWQALSIELPAQSLRAGGSRLEFTAQAEAAGARVAHLRIERRGATPSWRPVLWAFASGLACLLLLATAGVGARTLAGAGLCLWSGLAWCFAKAPLVAWPHAPSLAGVALLGILSWVVASSLAGALAKAHDQPVPGILTAASLGFVGWFSALTWPLYRGGHFGFHSQIAEEIWQGEFWRYYLPYPGSMLSRQAQWGDVIVPHPCLYHVLVAPLAALPREWFHWTEKLVLALLLAGLALIAGRLGQRAGNARLGTFSAALFCLLVPTYQLLGLGHLMTLLGVWAAALALSFVACATARLAEPRMLMAAIGLVALAFLSYTAALLFTGLVLFALALLAWRRERRTAQRLLMVLGGASLLAFALYYVHWAWPFLSQSLPRWVAGGTLASGAPRAATDQADRLARLMAQPGKLAYSYGHWLLPLLATVSLWSRRPATSEWRLLRLWIGVLWLFSLAVDPFFNLLLKHHYFVAVPVAVGLAAWLSPESVSPARRWVSWGLLLLAGLLGLRELVVVATGGAP